MFNRGFVRLCVATSAFFLLVGVVFAEEVADKKEECASGESDAVVEMRTMTLDDCIKVALRQNADVCKAREEIRRVDGVTVEVTAEAVPHVSANAGLAAEKQELAVSSPNSQLNQTYWSSGIRVTQLIFAGGSVTASIDMAELKLRSTFLELDRTIDRTVLDVRKAFYDVLINQSFVEVHEQSVKLLTEEMGNQKKRFDAGAVTKFNVLRAEVELANEKPKLIRAKNNYRLALVDLSRLLAIRYPKEQENPPFKIEGALKVEPVNFTLEKAIETALANRPELRIAEQQVDIQKKELIVSRAGFFPKISVYGGYDFDSNRFNSSLGEAENGWVAGVQGSWDIFDGLATAGKLEQSDAKLASAIISLDETKRTIDAEVRREFFRWQEAMELIESQKKNVEQAEESLRLAQARFDVGAGTQTDILNSQVALTEAKTNELQARYDYNVAVANLERVTATSIYHPKSLVSEQE